MAITWINACADDGSQAASFARTEFLCLICAMRIIRVSLIIVLPVLLSGFLTRKKSPEEIAAAKTELGRQLFFDKALSQPDGQSCTVCHAPKTSFSDPNHATVSEGMVDGAFVPRNSQSLAYVSFIPPLQKDANGQYFGGLFWDGRSNSLQEQAAGPLFNPAEMNNTDTLALLDEIRQAPYYYMYKDIYGKTRSSAEMFRNIAESIALFESSEVFNEFSSKYDRYLQGKAKLSEEEELGLSLFQGKANCVRCHSMETDRTKGAILFTDFSYHNLGVPKNPENPFYSTFVHLNPKGKDYTDLGLGAVVNDPSQNGKFRVPGLRNVQYTGPYFHNGYFKTLKEVVHFKNVRDSGGNYPDPEVKSNVDRQRTGNMNLSDEEENAIVAFLLTLSDGWEAE